MNKVILMGRLTRDPEIRYTQGEESMAIARFTLAVDRRRANANGEREADFISCSAFGKTAEFAEKYLHQGTKIAISGRIQTGSYTNKDGQKVYTTEVVIEEAEFAESKNAQNAQNGPQNYQGSNYTPNNDQGAYRSNPAPQAAYQQPQQQNAQASGNAAPHLVNRPQQPQPYAYSQNELPVYSNQMQGHNYADPRIQLGEGFMGIPEGVDEESLPFN